jgi:antitoxin component of MazEF toxin-antitoxin module
LKIERISKTYYSSSKKESVAVVIPKSIRDVLNVHAGSYVKWECVVTDDDIVLTLKKID